MIVVLFLKVMSKVGAAQEHVRKALDIKLSIESTICRIRKLNVVNVTDSQQMPSVASHGKQSIRFWSEMTYTVSGGALNSTQTKPNLI